MIDFERVKSSHKAWNTKLKAYLFQNEQQYEDELKKTHEECELGKWIYATALRNYSDIAEIHELEKVHKSIHTETHRLVGLKKGKTVSFEELNKEYEKYNQLVNKVLASIDIAKAKTWG